MSDDRPDSGRPDAVVEPITGEEVPAVDLEAVAFLRPDSPGTSPMPAEVWQRLEGVLAAEAARRGPVSAPVAAAGEVGAADPVPAAVIPITRARRSGPMRWAGGVVAAGVVVVAGAVVVPTMLAGTATVAGDAVTITLDASARASSPQDLAPAGGQPEAMPDAAAEVAPMAAVEPAAKVVLASNTVYTPKTLRSQVVDLVRQEGITSPEDAATYSAVTMDLPTLAGFTQSWDALRECLTRLAMPADATALLVDRGTYDGEPAGVIVAPDTGVDYAAAGESPTPTETVATASGLFDIWVVDEDCEQPTMTTLDNVLLFAR
jgi:hypothetical protein